MGGSIDDYRDLVRAVLAKCLGIGAAWDALDHLIPQIDASYVICGQMTPDEITHVASVFDGLWQIAASPNSPEMTLAHIFTTAYGGI